MLTGQARNPARSESHGRESLPAAPEALNEPAVLYADQVEQVLAAFPADQDDRRLPKLGRAGEHGWSGSCRAPLELLIRFLPAFQHAGADQCEQRVVQAASEWIIGPEDALDGLEFFAGEETENPSEAERRDTPVPPVSEPVG